MKEIEQRYNKSEETFRRILEAIPDLFLLVSTEGNFIDNSGKKEDFFVPPEEFIGKNITDVLPKEIGKNYIDPVISNAVANINFKIVLSR